MKRGFVLIVSSFLVLLIYNLIFGSVYYQPQIHIEFLIGESVAISLALVLCIVGVTSYYSQTSRVVQRPSRPVYTLMDPSDYTRVVRDGLEGDEILISGSEDTTFREACLDDWPFKNADKKSDWYVLDERGNDVSNEPLSRFDGLFTLIGTYRSDQPSNQSDDVSSIHDSVEYYD